MDIEFSLKIAYGKERYYPRCSNSNTLAKLMKCKSLTRKQLTTCKKAGWNVVVICTHLPPKPI